MNYTANDNIPQEGNSYATQSLSAPALCPTVSGGGNIRHEGLGPQTKDETGFVNIDSGNDNHDEPGKKMDTDAHEVPLTSEAHVVLTRCASIDERVRKEARSASLDRYNWTGQVTRSTSFEATHRTGMVRSVSSEQVAGDDSLWVGSKMLDLTASESEVSLDTATSRASSGGLWRKRRRDSGDTGDDDVTSPKVALSYLTSGRPPTTGHFIGLAKAKADLKAAKAKEMRLEAETALEEEVRKKREATAAFFLKSPKVAAAQSVKEGKGTAALEGLVQDSLATIEKVAKTSSNLKGTYVKYLREAAETIKVSMAEMRARTVPEEMARLETANARLSSEMELLRKEVEELRAARAQPVLALDPVPAANSVREPTLEDVMRTVMVQVGTMINARFEGLEERLLPEKRLRPPLAADRRREERMASQGEDTSRVPSPPRVPEPKAKQRKGKRGQGKKTAAVEVSAAKPAERPPSPMPLHQPWVEVVRRGARKVQREVRSKTTPQKPVSQARPQKPTKTKVTKLRPPRTAAVTITLLPGAETKGLTYAKILAEAKSRIDLGALEMPPLKIRTAATGARILEVPGADKSAKADSLAAKLKEVFEGAEDVRVSRPTVTTDLRVSGLDDSIAPSELLEALAKAGGCEPSAVKAGEIRRGAAGMGVAFARCPMTAAIKIRANGGRLLVGWVAARVQVLEVRPRRCYRCLAMGHVKAQCKSEVDRSEECYRCGKKGHKANDCSAAPHCTLCAAAGKPADHLSGGKACAKPPTKTGARRRKAATKARAKSQPSTTEAVQVDLMEES